MGEDFGWRVEVKQVEDEFIPTRWQRFFGKRVNDYAWEAKCLPVKQGAGLGVFFAFGATELDAVKNGLEEIRHIEGRAGRFEKTRKVYNV